MANQHRTNPDRLVAAVLNDSRLAEYGKYSADDYQDLDSAETSDNAVVTAVAKIVRGVSDGKSETAIYNEVSNYLKIQF